MTDARLWDADRLENIGHILDRYSSSMATGDRVRLGMDGDPLSPYASAEDAPVGTVTEVHRDDATGAVRFRAVLDGSGEAVDLDNQSIAPDRLWEIAPGAPLDVYRGRVNAALADGADAAADGEAREARAMDEERYRAVQDEVARVDDRVGSLENAVGALGDRLVAMDERLRAIGSDMSEGFRHASQDLINVSRGEAAEFAPRFVDRYDAATVVDGARAAESPPHDARHDFELPDDVAPELPDDVAGSEALNSVHMMYRQAPNFAEDAASDGSEKDA